VKIELGGLYVYRYRPLNGDGRKTRYCRSSDTFVTTVKRRNLGDPVDRGGASYVREDRTVERVTVFARGHERFPKTKRPAAAAAATTKTTYV